MPRANARAIMAADEAERRRRLEARARREREHARAATRATSRDDDAADLPDSAPPGWADPR